MRVILHQFWRVNATTYLLASLWDLLFKPTFFNRARFRSKVLHKWNSKEFFFNILSINSWAKISWALVNGVQQSLLLIDELAQRNEMHGSD